MQSSIPQENATLLTRIWQHNLGRRVISALIMAPPVLGMVAAGGVWFTILIAVASFILLQEWLLLPVQEDKPPVEHMRYESWLVYAVAALMLLLALTGERPLAYVPLAVAAGLYSFSAVVMPRRSFWPLAGLCYIMLPMLALLALREMPLVGMRWTFWLLFIVWATDIGGYVVGKKVGGPKLAPTISPGKTWSGLGGAVVFAMLTGGIFALCSGGYVVIMSLLAGVLAVIAQLGDLLESKAKRRFNKKDSGQLIPGHGGLLDRVDGVLAAALVLWVAMIVYPALQCGLGGYLCP